MKFSYKSTMYSCFIAYIVQAIPINFVPLLFMTFQDSFQLPLSSITSLITLNFMVQLLVDLLSAGFIDKIGYRASMIIAHLCSLIGLISLAILPYAFTRPFIGLFISVLIYATGGGLIEVLVSPMIEACPTDNKEKAMSLLHSFYCWGQMLVILFSTIFFALFGISNWRILSILWSILPAMNILFLTKVPVFSLYAEGEKGLSFDALCSNKIFWIFILVIMCAGACEHSVSQWASTFVEQELNIDKSFGDLVGPMAFAVFMGTSRTMYGKFGDRLNLSYFMKFSCILCIASYCCLAFVPSPYICILGCAICGFSVGILWPGSFSRASAVIKSGGTLMFALFALAGDLGCSVGPSIVGFVSSHFNNNLRVGFMIALIFPFILLLGLLLIEKTSKE